MEKNCPKGACNTMCMMTLVTVDRGARAGAPTAHRRRCNVPMPRSGVSHHRVGGQQLLVERQLLLDDGQPEGAEDKACSRVGGAASRNPRAAGSASACPVRKRPQKLEAHQSSILSSDFMYLRGRGSRHRYRGWRGEGPCCGCRPSACGRPLRSGSQRRRRGAGAAGPSAPLTPRRPCGGSTATPGCHVSRSPARWLLQGGRRVGRSSRGLDGQRLAAATRAHAGSAPAANAAESEPGPLTCIAVDIKCVCAILVLEGKALDHQVAVGCPLQGEQVGAAGQAPNGATG